MKIAKELENSLMKKIHEILNVSIEIFEVFRADNNAEDQDRVVSKYRYDDPLDPIKSRHTYRNNQNFSASAFTKVVMQKIEELRKKCETSHGITEEAVVEYYNKLQPSLKKYNKLIKEFVDMVKDNKIDKAIKKTALTVKNSYKWNVDKKDATDFLDMLDAEKTELSSKINNTVLHTYQNRFSVMFSLLITFDKVDEAAEYYPWLMHNLSQLFRGWAVEDRAEYISMFYNSLTMARMESDYGKSYIEGLGLSLGYYCLLKYYLDMGLKPHLDDIKRFIRSIESEKNMETNSYYKDPRFTKILQEISKLEIKSTKQTTKLSFNAFSLQYPANFLDAFESDSAYAEYFLTKNLATNIERDTDTVRIKLLIESDEDGVERFYDVFYKTINRISKKKTYKYETFEAIMQSLNRLSFNYSIEFDRLSDTNRSFYVKYMTNNIGN